MVRRWARVFNAFLRAQPSQALLSGSAFLRGPSRGPLDVLLGTWTARPVQTWCRLKQRGHGRGRGGPSYLASGEGVTRSFCNDKRQSFSVFFIEGSHFTVSSRGKPPARALSPWLTGRACGQHSAPGEGGQPGSLPGTPAFCREKQLVF